MIPYLLRRVLTGLVVFLSVTALCFFLLYARGGLSIAAGLLSEEATPEQIQLKAEQLGLLRPLIFQYGEWLINLLSGDFGASLLTGQSVTQIMATRIPVTVSLVALSLIVTFVLSVLIGVTAATRGGFIDRGLQVLSVVAHSLPNYWIALVLVIVFGITFRLFPATGFVPITTSFTGWLLSCTLPALAIAIGATAAVGQQIRGSMLDVLRQDYIRTLRSRGLRWGTIVFKHALRNASPAGLTILSLQVINTLGGAVIVERIFALPGLGQLAIDAGTRGDAAVVLGVVTFMVVVVVVINITVDVLSGFLSPKARIR